MVLRKLDNYIEKNKIGLLSSNTQKLTWNGLYLLNIWPNVIKLLEENKGKKILNIGLTMIFLDLTPKTWTTKQKSIGTYQTKNLLHSNKTINKIKGNL